MKCGADTRVRSMTLCTVNIRARTQFAHTRPLGTIDKALGAKGAAAPGQNCRNTALAFTLTYLLTVHDHNSLLKSPECNERINSGSV